MESKYKKLEALFASTFAISDDRVDRREESLILLRDQFQGLKDPKYNITVPELGENDYIILDHKSKRKFVCKEKYTANRLAYCKYLSLPTVEKAYKSLSKHYSRFGEGVDTNKNVDDIIHAFRSCLDISSFLPDIIKESDDFFEITYYSLDEYTPLSGLQVMSPPSIGQLDEYYHSVADLEMCICPDITGSDPNFYLNKNTKKLVLGDVGDLEFNAYMIPNLFEYSEDVLLVPDYKWSDPIYNNISPAGLQEIADVTYGEVTVKHL
jgi:hypothetical protein